MQRWTIPLAMMAMLTLTACTSTSTNPPTVNPGTPVLLNDGAAVTWTTRQTTTGTAAYSPLDAYIEQSGGTLSGASRDNIQEVDVVVSGSIDADGNVNLTLTLSN